jgi:hypothetical protein
MNYNRDSNGVVNQMPLTEIIKRPAQSAAFPVIQIAINSSTGSAGPLPLINTTLADPINVVSTSIDTRGMNRTNNILIFTCAINLPLGISVTINFQILRSTPGSAAAKVGSTYTFSTLADILESETFAFQFADTNLEQGNYTYAVEISTNSAIDVTPGLTINNGTLTVFAVNG